MRLLVFGLGRPWLKARTAERATAGADPHPALSVDYRAKLDHARALVGADVPRAAAVVRGMLRTGA